MTGKRVGWEPAEQSSFAKFVAEAVTGEEPAGTYELCGPKINGNPEHFDRHVVVSHQNAERLPQLDQPTGVESLSSALMDLPYEGVVWHHPDGRMAKLKRRDFPRAAS